MIIGEVIGNVWATRKDDALNGLKLLVIKPLDYASGRDLPTLVAVDNIGAGTGERVLVVKGSSARRALAKEEAPVDAIVVGIIDVVDVEDE